MRIAVIPARGGSKRIPRKNIRDFCGKPIIAYSIEAALECGLFDEVMVSTDNAEIEEVAKEYGASIPFMRSAANSGDFATTADVLMEVLGEYELRGEAYSEVCCIYPTAPFVTAKKLEKAYALFQASDADALAPIVQFSYPPLRGLVVRDGKLMMRWPEHINARTQDLEPLYHDCGQFYLIKTDALLKEKTLFCENLIPFEITEMEIQDIDNEWDWVLAELKYKMLTKH